ncbi:MAG: urea transporter [Flavobacteriaceae bacterium]|nr:urea transporter [Flavobacteriaceae bacterium]
MKLIKTTLVGIGQIFLQDNGWSGLLITIGMFFSHWTLGVTCFLGSLIGVLTAKALKAKEGDIEFGLYGFNASLAYMCVMFTFATNDAHATLNGANPILWVLGAVAAVIATVIMHVFVTKGWTAFTFPFVVTCWVLCWAFAKYNVLGLEQTTPALPDYTGTIDAITTPFYGWAEVNFGANFLTGVFIFLGLAISSPSVAMWGTAAATLGGLFAHYVLGIDANVLANGLYSFSPILVACAFVTKSGVSRADFVYIVVGVLLAVLIHYGVSQFMATYTIGFIVATWIMEAVQKAVNKSNPNTEELVKSLNP